MMNTIYMRMTLRVYSYFTWLYRYVTSINVSLFALIMNLVEIRTGIKKTNRIFVSMT